MTMPSQPTPQKPMRGRADMPDHALDRGYSDACLRRFREAANAVLAQNPLDVQYAMTLGHTAAEECMADAKMNARLRSLR